MTVVEEAGDDRSARREFTPFQTFARVAPVATLGWYYLVDPVPLDQAVAWSYDALYHWDVTHTGLFEAHVAAFSFVFWIACFSVVHLVLGPEATRRARLDRADPSHDALEWATPGGYRLWFNPLVSYLGSIWLYQQTFHTYRPPTPDPPSFGVLVAELLFGVVLYDLLFCPLHVLLHRGPFPRLVKPLHAYHHRRGGPSSLQPVETVQHSYVDGTLQVAVNIFVQHLSPFGPHKHLLSRLLHNVVVTYLLTESHSGYDFGWMTHNLWPEFLGGAPRHDRHHRDGRVCYQQYFKYIDDAMGWNDMEDEDVKKTVTTTNPPHAAPHELEPLP